MHTYIRMKFLFAEMALYNPGYPPNPHIDKDVLKLVMFLHNHIAGIWGHMPPLTVHWVLGFMTHKSPNN